MRDDPVPGAVAVPPSRDSPQPDRASPDLPSPATVVWQRLEDQLRWYDEKSTRHKQWFHRLKVAQIIIAALIPVIAAAEASVKVAGALGAVIVILEALQQLFQFQQNWVSYRATAEALKHEKFLYLASAGPYAGIDRPDLRLAERVEGLVSQEHAAWTASQKEAGKAAQATPV